MKRKMCTFTMVMLLAAGAPRAQENARTISPEAQKKMEVDRLASLAGGSCTYNFASGSGAKRLGWCVSAAANLVKFESPASVFHLREGLRSTGRLRGGITTSCECQRRDTKRRNSRAKRCSSSFG